MLHMGFRKRAFRNGPFRRRNWWKSVGILALLLAPFLGAPEAGAAAANRALPAPEIDPPLDAERETAVLAGGCFWGVQAVFQHTKGVLRATSGYAGGDAKSADYDRVSSGRTQHAEAVEVVFDPRQISYGELLRVFFSVALDPTELNRQGPDVGPQYRSEIFAADPRQTEIARAYVAQLDAAKVFDKPIATKVSAAMPFYPAEPYHQDFATRFPNHPYIVFHDKPKIAALRKAFPKAYRPEPVLVGKN